MARAIATIQIDLFGQHVRRTSYRFAPGELARAIEAVDAQSSDCGGLGCWRRIYGRRAIANATIGTSTPISRIPVRICRDCRARRAAEE